MLKIMEKKQFNARIPAKLRRATSLVVASLEWSNEDIAEVALATLLGSRDELLLAKKRKIEQAAKELHLSFDLPEHQSAGFVF